MLLTLVKFAVRSVYRLASAGRDDCTECQTDGHWEKRMKRMIRTPAIARHAAPPTSGNTEVADTLLAVGASSEGHGAWQRTPLHIAAYEAHTSAIRSLLGAGADPWAVNGRGQTPSDVSCMYNANGQVLELIEQAVDMRRVISTGNNLDLRRQKVAHVKQPGSGVHSGQNTLWPYWQKCNLESCRCPGKTNPFLYVNYSSENIRLKQLSLVYQNLFAPVAGT